MLSVTFDEQHNIFILNPRDTITRDDLDLLSDGLDAHIDGIHPVPSLVINADQFPGWTNFATLVEHFKLMRHHQRLVPKVAVVSDGTALSVLPHLADHFVKAQVRHFGAKDLQRATEWAADPSLPTGQFEWIEGLPSDVVAVRAVGIIGRREYEDVLLPAVRDRLREHEHLKCLFVLGDDFTNMTVGAMVDDAQFGLLHLGDFSRIAVVSDIWWIRRGCTVFAPLIRGELRIFANSALEQAKDWIQG